MVCLVVRVVCLVVRPLVCMVWVFSEGLNSTWVFSEGLNSTLVFKNTFV